MRLKLVVSTLFLFLFLEVKSQKINRKNFKRLSKPEKCWVITHPFIAKKALEVSLKARKEAENIKHKNILKGDGDGGQVDAFRHAYWMALLTQKIGWRKARNLGEVHEKGNYKAFKKNRLEDGVVPDKISSEMDLYNNNVGIEIGKNNNVFNLRQLVIETVKEGGCKVIKKDDNDNFLDCEGNVITKESLKGKWENNKCLVNSNE